MAISKLILNGVTQMDVTSDTVSAGKLLSGETATKNDGTKVTGTITTKSSADTTFSSTTGTFTAPSGYYSANATKAVTIQAAQTITPGSTSQYISSYQWLTGSQTIKGDANLVPSNIVSGVSIFGVNGTHEGGGELSSLTITPTEDEQTFNATAIYGYKPVTVNAISSTYIGTGVTQKSSADLSFRYATGTFTAPSGCYLEDAVHTLSTLSAQSITPSSISWFIKSNQWLTGVQTIKGDVNLVPKNIAKGTTIFGVTGTYSGTGEGTGINGIYKALTLGNMLYLSGSTFGTTASWSYYKYTSSDVANFCDIFTGIPGCAFINTYFSKNSSCSTITFNNASFIDFFAFASLSTLSTITVGNVTAFFPSCRRVYDYAFVNNRCFGVVDMPLCSEIQSHAFESTGIVSAYFSSATNISSFAFAMSPKLKTVAIPNCSQIMANTFSKCSALSEIDIGSCSRVYDYAFANCLALSYISIPALTAIAPYLFEYAGLETISNSIVSYVGSSAFYSCSKLSEVSFPNCGLLSEGAFLGCKVLNSVNFPLLSLVRASAFQGCLSLTDISIPSVQVIGSSAFYSCINLSMLYLPETSCISDYAFAKCYNLLSLYLLSTSMCSLTGYTHFSSTPISNYTTSTGGVYGSIFVPESLYDSYIANTKWKTYSSRFVSLTDDEIAALPF